MLDTCKDNSWKLQCLCIEVARLLGITLDSQSPIATWAEPLGHLGVGSLVGQQQLHGDIMSHGTVGICVGWRFSVALYEIDIILMVILILLRFYWWPFLNNRQYRWLNDFSFEPERSLLICPMFWSISALVRAVQKVEGRLMSCLSRSFTMYYVQQTPRLFWNPLWNTFMHHYAIMYLNVS